MKKRLLTGGVLGMLFALLCVGFASADECKHENEYVTYPTYHEPTCSEMGYWDIYCTKCNTIVGKRSYKLPVDHVYVEYNTATCLSAGESGKHCQWCGQPDPETPTTATAPLGHKMVITQNVVANCSQEGYTAGYCERCGDELDQHTPKNPYSHNWKPYEIPATCRKEGETGERCEWCQETRRVKTTEKLAHTYTEEVTIPATCEVGGQVRHVCSMCHEAYIVVQNLAALSHKTTQILEVQKATCQKPEITVYKCEREGCDFTFGRETGPTVDLTYGDWKVIKEATTTAKGQKVRYCTGCNLAEYEDIPMLSPTPTPKPTATPTAKPTATPTAKPTATPTAPVHQHKESVIKGMAATCENPGLTDTVFCTECGEILKQGEVIPAKGHTIVVDPAVPATDTTTGLTEGSHCSTCGKTLTKQEVIPALNDGKGDGGNNPRWRRQQPRW